MIRIFDRREGSHWMKRLGRALCVGAVFCLPASTARADRMVEVADGKVRPSAAGETREAYIPIKFASSHAANLFDLPNGDILCTWYSGSWENESDLAIVLSRLAKGSNRWTMPSVVSHEVGRSYQNPVLFLPPRGPLWLIHTSQAAGAGQAEAHMFRLISQDQGMSWSEPHLMFDQPGAFDRQRLTIVGDKWILPMYFTPAKDGGPNYSVVNISADQGKTWKTCKVPESDGLVQPDVIHLSPGHFVAFFRSRFADWVYKSTSPDGCSWTPPVPTRIPNNNASIQTARLRNGHLVMAFNNSQARQSRENPTGERQKADRLPVSIALSVDGGQTWPWVRDVETGKGLPKDPVPDTIAGIHLNEKQKRGFEQRLEAYEYPSVIQTADGALHVAYTFRRRTIKYVSFSEDWIRKGGTIGLFKGDRMLR
jgi:predicted neuraminidase